MNYTSLLLKIENHLLSLNKKGLKYINIECLSDFELKNVITSLEEIIAIEYRLSERTHENNSTKKYEKYEDNPKKNTEIKINTEPPNITSQTKVNILKQKNLSQTFAKVNNPNGLAKKFKSISELFENYKECQKCTLGQTRNKLVFGNGLSNPPVVFIGEGPGADEDNQGEPFVGRAGKLLTKMISSLGIERDDVYITNIVKCRPPENRNPTPAEISCCLPIIKQQIEILNPKLIVTLGNIPTKTLIPDSPGITKARGKIKHYEKWNVLPTFHPSYLLRNRSAMHQAWDDFKIITELAFNTTQDKTPIHLNDALG